MKILLISLILSLILASCDPFQQIKYKTGQFPEIPGNLEEINSRYDDYNSDLHIIGNSFLLSFSSNRQTMGNTFDVVRKNLRLEWNQMNGEFYFGPDDVIDWNVDLEVLIDSSNTSFNELGPWSFGYRYPENCYNQLFLWSSDKSGDFDLYYSFSKSCGVSQFSHTNRLSFVDSTANELYPSFFGEDFYFHDIWGNDPDKISSMIFCSDKNGQFDIYEVDFQAGTDMISSLSEKEERVSELLNVSSPQSDKCPFVNGKLLVFASDRPGGFGGFDLYYSLRINDHWSDPVNFGDQINTEFDEYRPITLSQNGFENDLLIFSSNRTGGKGGFDLYYVGITRRIN